MFFLLLVCSLTVAKQCDFVIKPGVWFESLNQDYSTTSTITGCRKGCFNNHTFTEDGHRKCEKCGEIKDQEFCEVTNVLRCQWKNGQCKAGTCPSIAKRWRGNDAETADLFKECMKKADTEKSRCDLNCTMDFFDPTLKTNCFEGCKTRYEYNGWTEVFTNVDGTATCNHTDSKDQCFYGYNSTAPGYNYACRTAIHDAYGYQRSSTSHRYNQKVRRRECHVVYGCMYSLRNYTCSYWSVWAYILTVVSVVLVVVGGGVALLFLLLKGKGGKTLFNSGA